MELAWDGMGRDGMGWDGMIRDELNVLSAKAVGTLTFIHAKSDL